MEMRALRLPLAAAVGAVAGAAGAAAAVAAKFLLPQAWQGPVMAISIYLAWSLITSPVLAAINEERGWTLNFKEFAVWKLVAFAGAVGAGAAAAKTLLALLS